MVRKTLLSWSSGKDSAWTLRALRQDPTVEVIGIFSVLNERYDRVSMHSTRSELLRLQAKAAGLDLTIVELPDPCSMEQCDTIMGAFVSRCASHGIECIAFGDLFLEDIRRYREKQMAGTGISTLFPLWQIPTAELARQMLADGLEAYISSVDLAKLPVGFAGRRWSSDLIAELPEGIDPCGENGEFHTIVVDGSMFTGRIDVDTGEIVQRGGFAYADIVPRR